MKYELLKHLLIEETRLHSALRGAKSFFFYPVVLLLGTALTAFFMTKYSTMSGIEALSFSIIVFFFMFGFISGSFGLHATDYLERRFGDFGKLFSNVLVLPVKLSDVFLMAAISDSIFYAGWFILPLIGGAALGIFLAGASIMVIPLLLLSVTFAFVLGIGISFFLSVLITKSKIFFITGLILLLGGYVYIGKSILLPYVLYMSFSMINLLLNVILIIFFFAITGLIIGNEYNTIKKKGKYTSFKFGKINTFLFKDYIDLSRTHGLIAKPLFNVLIPSILMLVILSSVKIFQGELSLVTNNLIFVAIFLGTMSVNFFNVLISGDSFSYYVFLPVSLRQFIWPKIFLAELICGIQGAILLLIYAYMNSIYTHLFASLILLFCFTFYTLCVNFNINGLKPNENSINLKSLGLLMLFFLPVALLGMIFPFFFTASWVYMIFSIFLILAGYMFYSFGIKRWRNIG